MNPFVDPKKRSVTLPKGCKDLMDVLTHSDSKHGEAIRRFIRLVLLQAQQEQATELIIGITAPSGVLIRYNVEGNWHEMSPFPSHIRPDVVSELVRMADFHAGQIPGKAVLEESFGNIRLRWIVAVTVAEGECILTRLQD